MSFIVLEGIEGSGKSTLLNALAAALRRAGDDVIVTREPGGTPAGDAVRDIFLNKTIEISPLTEVLLVNAARAQHVAELIRPALSAGRTVLCDRFIDSTLAYQGYARGLNLTVLREICDVAAAGTQPDMTLLLDLPVSSARGRLLHRASTADRIEREDDAFHERVRQGFLTVARGSPRHRVIDAARPPERVLEEALEAVGAISGSAFS